MTSRQSAFFFFNSDPMMQNIYEIDYLLLLDFTLYRVVDKDQRP